MAGLARATSGARAPRRSALAGYGPLVADPYGKLDLPEGFHYVAFSTFGEEMDDGLLVPAGHDGMAAFPGADGKTRLVRNHELVDSGGPFGVNNERLERIDQSRIYDAGHGQPLHGGTTTLVFDTASGKLERHFLSLAGTGRNCAGGATPWGSWVTCEEFPMLANERFERDHGWCFEVPADADAPVDPVPLEGLGRFNHEAIAVDADSGVVYLTEDQNDSLFYRFVPDEPGNLRAGGKLQALAIRGAMSLDTRNWHAFTKIQAGEEVETSWVTLDDIHSPDDDLRHRGFVKGAARFARGEGMWAGNGAIWFTATSGGAEHAGQVWRYTPSPDEGDRKERRNRGTLNLFIESPGREVIDNCDNLTIAPWGDVYLCEDGPGANHIVGVTTDGEVYPFARNAIADEEGSASEFAGACFAPDGSTLFCSAQGPGITYAISGPWQA